MFIQLTGLDGLKIYININKIIRFNRDDYETFLEHDGNYSITIKETPEEILTMIERKRIMVAPITGAQRHD